MAKLKFKHNNSTYSVTDDSVRDAEVAAIVDRYGAKNLLNYNELSSQTIHGVDVIVNSDKSITANGTNDGTLTQLSLNSNLNFPIGTYILSDGGYSTQFGGHVYIQLLVYGGGLVAHTSMGDYTFTVSDPNTRYVTELVIAGGKTLAGTFYPMIRDARITDPTYVPYAMTNRELTERASISQDVYIGASGHETSVRFLRNGHIGMYIFDGPWYGHTTPAGIAYYQYQRGVLIGGQGSERWPMHIESPSGTNHIYIHKEGSEVNVPNDGTYNIYGTYIFFIQ